MGLDLWFREDVTRILLSAQETLMASREALAPVSVEAADAYQQGFVDALRAVGVAFGVTISGSAGRGQEVQSVGTAGRELPQLRAPSSEFLRRR